MSGEKAVLRRHLIARMKQLSPDEVWQASQAACSRALNGYDWSHVHSILAYTPLEGSGEIDPAYLLDALRDHAEITYVTPEKHAPFPNGAYDVIIVPIVGLNDDQYRLGRGGGWYDRLLSQHPESQSIGLAYQWGGVSFLPESHDQRISIVFTDETDAS